MTLFDPARARIAHSMLRVGDLDRSIAFYCDVLGMRVLRRGDMPDEGRRNVFLGYDAEAQSAVLELTELSGRTDYEKGDGYGHLALQFADLGRVAASIAANGGKLESGPTANPQRTVIIAFILDPDGYEIELIERPGTPEPA